MVQLSTKLQDGEEEEIIFKPSLKLRNGDEEHPLFSNKVVSSFQLEDEEEDDYMKMYFYKIIECGNTKPHDWTNCPFAHPSETARRRDPRTCYYSSQACPQYRQGGSTLCPRGDQCQFAHGIFECWLHPDKYHTAMCKDGENCSRKCCFFAHKRSQLRNFKFKKTRPYVDISEFAQPICQNVEVRRDPGNLNANDYPTFGVRERDAKMKPMELKRYVDYGNVSSTPLKHDSSYQNVNGLRLGSVTLSYPSNVNDNAYKMRMDRPKQDVLDYGSVRGPTPSSPNFNGYPTPSFAGSEADKMMAARSKPFTLGSSNSVQRVAVTRPKQDVDYGKSTPTPPNFNTYRTLPRPNQDVFSYGNVYNASESDQSSPDFSTFQAIRRPKQDVIDYGNSAPTSPNVNGYQTLTKTQQDLTDAGNSTNLLRTQPFLYANTYPTSARPTEDDYEYGNLARSLRTRPFLYDNTYPTLPKPNGGDFDYGHLQNARKDMDRIDRYKQDVIYYGNVATGFESATNFPNVNAYKMKMARPKQDVLDYGNSSNGSYGTVRNSTNVNAYPRPGSTLLSAEDLKTWYTSSYTSNDAYRYLKDNLTGSTSSYASDDAYTYLKSNLSNNSYAGMTGQKFYQNMKAYDSCICDSPRLSGARHKRGCPREYEEFVKKMEKFNM